MCYIIIEDDETSTKGGMDMKKVDYRRIDRELELAKLEMASRINRVNIIQ